MNGFWIVSISAIIIWLLLSQLIACLLNPKGTDDQILETWFAVFMAPILILWLGLGLVEVRFRAFARQFGWRWFL